MNMKSAIAAIDRAGILLVFPIANRKEPASLWSHFFPRKKMRWEWDESGDDGVADLWHLKTEISTTRQVVYTKWFQGRATYFSKPLFQAALRALNPKGDLPATLSAEARRILAVLETDSPVSTKALKQLTGLRGRENEKRYNRALKELWSRLLIVAFGEVDDGAFPSLAVGSTRVLFENLWEGAFKLTPAKAETEVRSTLTGDSPFFRHFNKLMNAHTPKIAIRSRKPISMPRQLKVIHYKDL